MGQHCRRRQRGAAGLPGQRRLRLRGVPFRPRPALERLCASEVLADYLGPENLAISATARASSRGRDRQRPAPSGAREPPGRSRISRPWRCSSSSAITLWCSRLTTARRSTSFTLRPARQLKGADQAVVAGADDDHVVAGLRAHGLSWSSWVLARGASRRGGRGLSGPGGDRATGARAIPGARRRLATGPNAGEPSRLQATKRRNLRFLAPRHGDFRPSGQQFPFALQQKCRIYLKLLL